jgi:transporter family protein
VLRQHLWLAFALGSALFAGLTAILGKVGVAGINSNLATYIRTCVILVFTAGILSARSEWATPTQTSTRSWTFLILSGVATGASWLCYYRALQLAPASRVAPIDKLSVVIAIVSGVAFLGEPLGWKLMLGGALIVAGTLVIATI